VIDGSDSALLEWQWNAVSGEKLARYHLSENAPVTPAHLNRAMSGGNRHQRVRTCAPQFAEFFRDTGS